MKAGNDFWIGWQIVRNPGWHTYWEHPGDVGVPPKLEWDLPEGFSVSPMQYAPPEKVKMASIRANGNYGETLFITKIKVPENLELSDYTFKAKASWLTCSRQCLPGFTDLEISIKAVDLIKKDKMWSERFEELRNSKPSDFSNNWKLSAVEKGSLINLIIQRDEPFIDEISRPIFFCSNRLIRSDGKQLLIKKDNFISLKMEKSEWARKDESYLAGIIYSEKGWADQSENKFRKINLPLFKSN